MIREDRFWAKVAKSTEEGACWLWAGKRSVRGYGQFLVDGHRINAHRVAYILTHPAQDISGLLVCHACDNPRCVNPAHLWLGTYTDNMQDMVRKQRKRLGGNVKLNRQSVDDIRALAAQGHDWQLLAHRYGVCRQTIWEIVTCRTWK